jgi:hypothetical protein
MDIEISLETVKAELSYRAKKHYSSFPIKRCGTVGWATFARSKHFQLKKP